jgi:pimeloyl-ACP methyl ester carboxylesterase
MSEPRSRFLAGSPRLHYLEWNPRGRRTIIFLHGNSANAWWWQWVAECMPPRFRLVALDQRGHGDSEWVNPPAYKPEDYAGDLRRFIAATCDCELPLVVGHSMGGIGVLAFAERYPDRACGAVVVDVAVTSSRMRDRYLRRLRALPTVVYPDLDTARARFRLMPNEGGIPAERLSAIAERSLAPAAKSGYTLKFDRESFFGGDGLHVMETIGKLALPTLLVRAGRSRIMTQEAAEAAAASNPRVELVVIPDAHHHVLLEKPQELARVIAGFAEGFEG